MSRSEGHSLITHPLRLLCALAVLLIPLLFGPLSAGTAHAANTITISDSASCEAAGGTWTNPGTTPASARCIIGDFTVAADTTLQTTVHTNFSSLTNYGTVTISATSGTENSLTNAAGAVLNIVNGPFGVYGTASNAGTITLMSGTMGIVAPLTNTSTGQITIEDRAILFLLNVVTNQGTITTICDGFINYSGSGSVTGNPVQTSCPSSDTSAPMITPSISDTTGSNGWYVSDVTVSWSVSDAESSISSQTGCDSSTVSSDTSGVTFTCQATSAGGTASQSVTIQRDATAPTISAAATSSPNANTWYNSPVSVHFSCDDNLSGVVSCPVDQTLSAEGAAVSSSAQSVSDRAGNSASSNVVTVNIDRSAPTISAAATSSPNANGWYKSDVAVAFSCNDTLSGVAGCPAPQTLSSQGAAVSSSAQSISDRAGNTSAPSNIVTMAIDKTVPVVSVTGVTAGANYPIGSVPTAACSTSDTLSGVASVATLSISGGNADGSGSFTATCAGASDKAGNSGSASVSYSVAYRWSGFFQPIDNLPTINSANAGKAVPVKFSLGGNYGLNIFVAGYPASQQVACSDNASVDDIEQTATAGTSSLSYDPASGQYSYTWKTEKSWAGQCRVLVVRLIDGTEHTASFKFK